MNNNDDINRRGYVDKKMHFWIGLSDITNEGDWRLASNGLKPSYLNWHKNEPRNHTDYYDCARLRTGPYPSWKDTWASTKCESEMITHGNHGRHYLHAICEYDSLVTNSTEDTATKGASAKS